MSKPNVKQAAAGPEEAEKLPPHSPEAEAGVLGCCILGAVPNSAEPDAIGDTNAALKPEAFYDLRNREIWMALLNLYTARKPIDLISLSQTLKDAGMLEQVGGLAYLMELPNKVPSALNIGYYREIVREKWQLRRLLAVCSGVASRVWDYEGPVDRLLDEAERDLLAVSDDRVMQGEAHSMKELVLEAITKIEDQVKRGKKWKIGPQTPWNYVNNIIPGFGPGDFVIVAARPSTGKSAMVMQIAEQAALREGVPAYVLSLEMSAMNMTMREMFQHAGADLTKMRNGFLSEGDLVRLTTHSPKLANAPWWIEAAHRMYLEDLELKARRMKRKHGIGMLVVDYFQLLHIRARTEDRVKELNETSMRLKALAMELEIPVILCAQMNRNIETSEKKRPPMLSDLKDCGQLEQDADIVMMLWKPTIKDPEDGEGRDMKWLPRMADAGVPQEWMGLNRYPVKKKKNGEPDEPDFWEKHLRRVNCYVAKQREGRADEDAALVFVKDWCRFVDAWRPEGGDEPEAPKGDEMPSDEEMGRK